MSILKQFIIGIVIIFFTFNFAINQSTPQAIQVSSSFERGIIALDESNAAEALNLFTPIYSQNPDSIHPIHGSIALWYGFALDDLDSLSLALSTWELALKNLRLQSRLDLRLAHTYIHRTYESESEDYYADAALNFMQYLSAIDLVVPEIDRSRMDLFLHRIYPLLSDQEIVDFFTDCPDDSRFKYCTTPGAGRKLTDWWNAKDPLPASQKNERVIEHLIRVAYVEKNFKWDEGEYGLDARGIVYLRFGPPWMERKIGYTDRALFETLFRPGMHVGLDELLDNAFWFYPRIDDSMHYLFVKKGKGYKIGTISDLIPNSLTYGISNYSSRGRLKSESYIMFTNSILMQLAQFHDDYTTLYLNVAQYASAIQEVKAESLQPTATRNAISGEMIDVVNNRLPSDLSTFVYTSSSAAHLNSAQQRRTRLEHEPSQHTSVLNDAETIDIAWREARFLNEDGTTRTEIYWSPLAGSLMPSRRYKRALRKDGYDNFDAWVIDLVSMRQTLNHITEKASRKRYIIEDLPTSDDVIIPPKVVVIPGNTSAYNIALQFDQYMIMSEADKIAPEPEVRVKRAIIRSDSIQALNNDENHLETSDLRALFVPQDPEAEARPYPFEFITPATPLGLEFEVYHLLFGEDDLTHYSVEYEVTRTPGTGIADLFRRNTSNRTSVSAQYTSRNRKASEYILLDLSDWVGSGYLDIKLRITDQTSGEAVERTITFKLTS